jgi:hypothetical protein
MNFTLGLSGWTANDWSQAGNFDLMAPRAEVDEFTKRRVFDGLKKRWFARPTAWPQLGIDRGAVLGGARHLHPGGSGDLRPEQAGLPGPRAEPRPAADGKLRFANEREAGGQPPTGRRQDGQAVRA